MESSSSLLDLPVDCLHLIARLVAAVEAAKLRTACLLLLEVVDATWEPAPLSLPPHKRTVPLTLQQVQAQLPRPHNLRAYCTPQHSSAHLDEYGRDPMHVSTWGPALVRLTAHLAANVLPCKPLVCWAPHSTSTGRAPVAAAAAQAGGGAGGGAGAATGSSAGQSHPAARRQKQDALGHMLILSTPTSSQWPPADSEARAALLESVKTTSAQPPCWCGFQAVCLWPPAEVSTDGASPAAPVDTCLIPSLSRGLQVRGAGGYRPASTEELQDFVSASDAGDGGEYDMLLHTWPYVAPVYVFLDPHPPCVTGRRREGPVSFESQ